MNKDPNPLTKEEVTKALLESNGRWPVYRLIGACRGKKTRFGEIIKEMKADGHVIKKDKIETNGRIHSIRIACYQLTEKGMAELVNS